MSDNLLNCDEGLALYKDLLKKNEKVNAINNENLAQYMKDMKKYQEAVEYQAQKHKDWENKTGDYAAWAAVQENLRLTPYINAYNCQLWNQVSGEQHDDWCPPGYFHMGGAPGNCIQSRGVPVCYRNLDTLKVDLNNAGYANFEPKNVIPEPVKPVDLPQNQTSAIINCCNNKINLNNTDAINLIQQCQSKISQGLGSSSTDGDLSTSDRSALTSSATNSLPVSGKYGNVFIFVVVILLILSSFSSSIGGVLLF